MVEGMIRVAFWIGVALQVVVLVIFVLYELFMKKELDDDFVKTLLRIVTAVIVTAMGIGVSWLWMVFMLASTEFVQVIIDIENNTRTSAETLGDVESISAT